MLNKLEWGSASSSVEPALGGFWLNGNGGRTSSQKPVETGTGSPSRPRVIQRDPVVTLRSVGPSPACAKTRNRGEIIVSIKFTAIRPSSGTTHQHIIRLWWSNPSTSKSDDNSRAELVFWIDQGGKAYVEDNYGNRVDVGVVTPSRGEKYLRTYADGKWTDNLLALPRR